LIIALLGGAWLVPGAAAQRPSNVIGTLARSGVPTCPRDEPCDRPAVAAVVSFTRRGHAPKRVLAGTRFRVRLAPGRYRISARSPAVPMRTAAVEGALGVRPSAVRVPSHGVVYLHLRLTTGG
jgi:hypothetical protein